MLRSIAVNNTALSAQPHATHSAGTAHDLTERTRCHACRSKARDKIQQTGRDGEHAAIAMVSALHLTNVVGQSTDEADYALLP